MPTKSKRELLIYGYRNSTISEHVREPRSLWRAHGARSRTRAHITNIVWYRNKNRLELFQENDLTEYIKYTIRYMHCIYYKSYTKESVQ